MAGGSAGVDRKHRRARGKQRRCRGCGRRLPRPRGGSGGAGSTGGGGGTCLAFANVRTQADVDALRDVRCIDGDLSVTGAQVTHLDDLDALQRIGGALRVEMASAITRVELRGLASTKQITMTSDGALVEVLLPALTSVGGSVSFSLDGALRRLLFPALTTVAGGIGISGGRLTELELSRVTDLPGGFGYTGGSGALPLLALPALRTSGGYFTIQSGDVVAVSAPLLTRTLTLWIANNARLTSLDLSSLSRVDSNPFQIYNNAVLTSFALPALETVGGYIYIGDGSTTDPSPTANPLLKSVLMPRLTTVAGSSEINDAKALEEVDLSSLTSFGTDVYIISGAHMRRVSMRALVSTSSWVGVYAPAGLDLFEAPALRSIRSLGLSTLTAGAPMLPLLTQVSGALSIGADSDSSLSFPAVSRVDGDLSLRLGRTPAVAFPALTTVGGAVTIDYSDGLTDLAGLAGLTQAASVTVNANARLPRLALPGLTTTGYISVGMNPLLTAIAFPALQDVAYLSFVGNARLPRPNRRARRAAGGGHAPGGHHREDGQRQSRHLPLSPPWSLIFLLRKCLSGFSDRVFAEWFLNSIGQVSSRRRLSTSHCAAAFEG